MLGSPTRLCRHFFEQQLKSRLAVFRNGLAVKKPLRKTANRLFILFHLFRVIWLNVYKVLLCLHCWGITTIRCPSMLAYGLANNNLVCILCSEDGLY